MGCQELNPGSAEFKANSLRSGQPTFWAIILNLKGLKKPAQWEQLTILQSLWLLGHFPKSSGSKSFSLKLGKMIP